MKPQYLRTLLRLALVCLIKCSLPALAAPSSDDALTFLKEGNARYLAGKSIHPNQDAARRAVVAKAQHPFATVLTCSDSRVSPEILFDQGLGDLFVVRVAGNVADTDEIGTVEYGAGHLGTPLLIVLGHAGCGAVKAVLEGTEVHGSIPQLVDNIAPAVGQVKAANPNAAVASLLGEAVKANVGMSLDNLLRRSAEVRALVKAGKLQILGAVYDLETGQVNWLGTHPDLARVLDQADGAQSQLGKTVAGTDSNSSAASLDHVVKDAGRAVEPPSASGLPGDARLVAVSPIPAVSSPVEPAPRNWQWIIGTFFGLLVTVASSWIFAKTFMPRWQVPQRIAGGFALVLLVLAGVGFAGYQSLHRAFAEFTEYRTDARHSNRTGLIEENYLNLRIAAKDLVIFRSPDSVQRYEAHKTKLGELLKEAETQITEPERLKSLQRIESLVATHAGLHVQLREAVFAGKTAAAAEINKKMGEVGTGIATDARELKEAFLAEQNRAGPLIRRDLQEAQVAISCIACAAMLLGGFLAWLVSRSIVAPLRHVATELAAGADQTAAASSQVAAASQTLAEGASEQAASLEETSASLEEVSSMVKRNAEAAEMARTVAEETRIAADTGAAAITEMNTAMGEIKGSSSEVAKIVKSIDEIAFQTNILALNAAVEAARAGEAGAGFAVVADEVRTLAQRSAAAAKETAAKIEAAIDKSERGVQISTKVAASFEQIVAKTRQVNQYVAEIAASSQEQAQGVDQVSKAVAEMDKITQSNAASAEESASAAEELNAQAASVEETARTLKRLVGEESVQKHRETPAHPTSAPIKTPALPQTCRSDAKKPVRTGSHSVRSNGHAKAASAPADRTRSDLPMPEEVDFRNF